MMQQGHFDKATSGKGLLFQNTEDCPVNFED